MGTTNERRAPKLLWEPSPERIERATITRYQAWLERERGLRFEDYEALWEWSVAELEAFWGSIVEFFDVRFSAPADRVLGRREMPGAEWFPGRAALLRRARVPRQARRGDGDPPRLGAARARLLDLGRAALADRADRRRAAGARASARATAWWRTCRTSPRPWPRSWRAPSIGAVWSSAAPEFGARSVIDRFAQIEPKVLLAIDGYRYGGKDFDRGETRRARSRPRSRRWSGWSGSAIWTAAAGRRASRADGELTFAQVPFDHPLWVLYSSGTTGLPKPIVHSQGGILLEQLKKMHLHVDAQAGDRVFWFSTTGWMMWNFLVGVLLTDASIVLFDGNPGYPSLDSAVGSRRADAGITTFGTSAAFIASCMKAEVRPGEGARPERPASGRLDRLAAVARGLSVGLRPARAPTRGCSRPRAGPTCARRSSAACRRCPVYLGELQARSLGAAVQAWDPDGKPLIDEVGELVITEPMPSMPIFFWGDDDGERLRESLLLDVPGDLAPRRLDRDHLARDGDHLRPLGLDDQPRRRADGDERDLPGGAVAARGGRRAGRRPAPRRDRRLDAAVRGAARGRARSTTS